MCDALQLGQPAVKFREADAQTFDLGNAIAAASQMEATARVNFDQIATHLVFRITDVGRTDMHAPVIEPRHGEARHRPPWDLVSTVAQSAGDDAWLSATKKLANGAAQRGNRGLGRTFRQRRATRQNGAGPPLRRHRRDTAEAGQVRGTCDQHRTRFQVRQQRLP